MNSNNKTWQVEFYGEGTSCLHDHLTYERACQIQKGCPKEYVAILTPMIEEAKDDE